MASDLSIPCVRDGKPSSPHEGGEHHIKTKGMGGLGPKAPVSAHKRVPLCRGCHNAAHLGEFTLSIDMGVATGHENGMVVFERGMVVRDEGADSLFWSDEKLSQEWANGEERAQGGFEQQCNAAFEFHRRYRGHAEWSVRVAEIISDNTGQYIHPREVYRRIKLYVAFNDDWTTYRRLGKTLALAVAESDNIKTALEIAEAARDTGGRTGASIIREIQGKPEPEPKTCPHCGGEL